ncbi:MAG TPA: DegT/DnrJ/EryC1/StrS family aminotransferase [Gemmatimonadaceae bacterium]|jgi:dTDP-4-amino-4,6-dideoxygalactose transaminase|nr:DegT/DnrJ/EryC1/StrS family aminotransferase [Gemmatimonadaceae bacterium]
MTVPFLDLKAQYASIKTEIDEAVLRVLASATYVLGPEVDAFEREFASLHNVRHAVAVNTGTSALHVALLAAGIKAGDEVITVSMTFIATVSAIRYTGATPVFVDIDPVTATLDVAQIESKITPRTRAIMPVHLYGQPADMDPIMEIAKRRNLIVIEDAAQAHAAEYKGRRVGGIGQIAGFSFYPGKNLGAYGEAGVATTNDDTYAHTMRLLRDWGQEKKYYHDVHAFNYRMDAIQGAILRVKLRQLDKWTDARRANARRYDELLAASGITRASEVKGRKHVYHIYGVYHERRSELQAALQAAGIHTGIHYPIPVHLQKAYADLGYREGDLPVTEKIAREQLSLPMFPELADDQIRRVAKEVADWAGKKV